ncbi:MAG: hypothetical protein M5R40_26065 [Anaerolineae bacterium]|nr:hypothetical protein [Anaerolineae bacterium]
MTIVYANAAELSSESLEAVYTYCRTLKEELEQEAFAVEIDGVLYIF